MWIMFALLTNVRDLVELLTYTYCCGGLMLQ